MTTIPDSLPLLVDLAADSGLTLSMCDVITDTDQAGVLDDPARDAHDLTPNGATAVDLLLAELAWRAQHVMNGTPQLTAALRIRVAARMAGLLLPATTTDQDGLFTLIPDQDGYLPPADAILRLLRGATQRLHDYANEHHHSQWVDPNAVAGVVADIHDIARMLTAGLACGGPASLMDQA